MMFTQSQSILAGLTQDQLQLMLTEAQTAYGQLMAGGKVVSVSYEGKSVTYSQAQSGDLVSWIMLLQRALGIGGSRQAIRPYFR